MRAGRKICHAVGVKPPCSQQSKLETLGASGRNVTPPISCGSVEQICEEFDRLPLKRLRVMGEDWIVVRITDVVQLEREEGPQNAVIDVVCPWEAGFATVSNLKCLVEGVEVGLDGTRGSSVVGHRGSQDRGGRKARPPMPRHSIDVHRSIGGSSKRST